MTSQLQAHSLRIGLMLCLLLVAAPAEAQTPPVGLDASCVVNLVNRTTPVAADGSWAIANAPANLGLIRARATCVRDGQAVSGQSERFLVAANGTVDVPPIRFEAVDLTAEEITLTSPVEVLTAAQPTVQLQVIAGFADGSTADVSASVAGTTYAVSDPAIMTVSANGRVTALTSGRVAISASRDGDLALLLLDAVLADDSDGDGLADDLELAEGLDPNDPIDALEDADGDGLSNRQELLDFGTGIRVADSDGDGLVDGEEIAAFGTQPLLFDTDGDGLSDGLEIQTGSDPLDPQSFDLAAALSSISVDPPLLRIRFDTVFGEASRQLDVTGTLIDGTVLDLTRPIYGTAFSSSDLGVASFGLEPGRVFAGRDGTAEVTATNSGVRATAAVVVESFSPTALSFVRIPGFANSVALMDDYAIVAAGREGLAIVDISDLEQPFIAASIDTLGNANDVRVVGTHAYVADGSAGLVIIDLTDPLLPVLAGAVDLDGDATDLVVVGGRAYIANSLGLRIVDVADPVAPVLSGAIDFTGRARGVDVYEAASGTFAVVAASRGGVVVIAAEDPSAPRVVGQAHTRAVRASRAAAVTVRGNLAYVADGSDVQIGGLAVVDLTEPENPVTVGVSGGVFSLTDVVLDRGLALTADIVFANAVPIFNVDTASGNTLTPTLNSILDFSAAPAFRDDNGSGIAARDGIVFMTGVRGFPIDNGVAGDSSLHIGRYASQGEPDNEAPTVELGTPVDGDAVLERRTLRLVAEARDNQRVEAVQFFVEDEVVATDFRAPFVHQLEVPAGVSRLTVGAEALDATGNRSPRVVATVDVLPDQRPTVRILAPLPDSRPVEGTTVPIAVRASDDVAVSQVEIRADGVLLGSFTEPPYRVDVELPLRPGPFAIEVTAIDDIGQATVVSSLLELAPDVPPAVAILVPVDGAELLADTTIEVLIGADDEVGVAEVEISVDGISAPPRSEPPYTFEIAVPADISELRLSATARDTRGQQTTTEESVFQVVSELPVVRIVTPILGETVREGAPVGVEAFVGDDFGATEVLLLVDGVVVETWVAPPYRAEIITAVGVSQQRLEVLAIDAQGQTASDSRLLTVVADTAPTVVLVDPAPGTVLIGGATLDFRADASDESAVAAVTFRVEGSELVTLSSPPFEVPFTASASAETLFVEVIAEDDSGQTSTVSRRFAVAPNQPPMLSLSAPAEGALLVAGGQALVSAVASDDIGVAAVVFTVRDLFGPGSDLVQEITQPPFAFTLAVPASIQTLTLEATATDVLGVSTSRNRTFEVVGDAPTTVIGLVVDPDGLPVTDAAVLLTGASDPRTLLSAGFTDSIGRFSFSGVSAGQGDLTARASAFDTESSLVGTSLPVVPLASAATDLGTIELAPQAAYVFGDLCGDVTNPLQPEPFAVTCVDSQVAGSDILGVDVTLGDAVVLFTVRLGTLDGPLDPARLDAVLSLDLGGEPTTGVASRIDDFSPHPPTGLGADLEILVERGESDVPLTFTADSFTLAVPRTTLGDADFRFAVATFQVATDDIILLSLPGDPDSEDEADSAIPLKLSQSFNALDFSLIVDVAPNGGSYRLPSAADADGDGLADRGEILAGTDPFRADSDEDGLTDVFEIGAGLDPLAFDDPFGDADGDGLTAAAEQFYGSDPLATDSDEDGLSDGEEVVTDFGFLSQRSLPGRFDSDGDGLSDGEEVALFTGELNVDSDFDGLDDGAEVALGTEPLDFDSDGDGASDGLEVRSDATDPRTAGDGVAPLALGDGAEPAKAAQIVADRAGRVHAVWSQDVAGGFGSTGDRILYSLVSSSGELLIAPTQLADTESSVGPRLVLGSEDRVHVVWQGRLEAPQPQVFHALLDPALDDRDGSSADPAFVRSFTRLSASSAVASRQPRAVLDDLDRLHVAWVDSIAGAEIHYARLAAGGAVEIADQPLVIARSSRLRDLTLAQGPAADIHLAWSEPDSAGTLVYALLDGELGALVIAATEVLPIEPDVVKESPTVLVEADGRLSLVYRRAETFLGLLVCGELRRLRWEHIDLNRQTVHLPDTKNGEARTVPFVDNGC